MNKRSQETRIIVALSLVEELSLKKKKDLLSQLPNPLDWVAEKNADTICKILGDSHKTEFLTKYATIDSYFDDMEKREVSWITFYDEEYPEVLREIYDFPMVLFAKGNTSLLNSDCIAVIGTRTPTRYGQKVADSFTRDFARAGMTIVSGFARGVDSIAHKACTDTESPTIAVFACGLDTCYPAEHRGLYDAILNSGGLVVTEYPLGTKPLQYHFPERNRIISGLSRGVFIPEATVKSGSLITARLSIEQGKELFVVPGNINSPESEGTNKLLQEMPHALVISSEDVLSRLGVRAISVDTEVVELNICETLVVEALHDKELHFEELLEITSLGAGELSTLLMNLEINGIIEQTGGNYYSLA
ncbi:MAG: DNA-processing protein DprA [Clostridia bacterium]|nr:DNA-processing protein DprA [Clostridia bacterium]